MSSPLLRPLSIGEVLDGGFTLYRQHFTTLFGCVVLLHAPTIVPTTIQLVATDPILSAVATILGGLLTLVTTALSLGAVITVASRAVLGESVGFGEAIRTGLKSFLPLLVMSLVYGVALAFAAGVPVVAIVLVVTLGAQATELAVLGLILMPLALVPVALLWVVWFAWAQVIHIEGRWSFFARSVRLAKGSWLKIFAVLVLCAIISSLPSIVYAVGMFAAIGLESFIEQQSSGSTLALPLITGIGLAVGQLALTGIVFPFNHAVVTLLYFDQRVRKEGLDVEVAAAAIDALPATD